MYAFLQAYIYKYIYRYTDTLGNEQQQQQQQQQVKQTVFFTKDIRTASATIAYYRWNILEKELFNNFNNVNRLFLLFAYFQSLTGERQEKRYDWVDKSRVTLLGFGFKIF